MDGRGAGDVDTISRAKRHWYVAVIVCPSCFQSTMCFNFCVSARSGSGVVCFISHASPSALLCCTGDWDRKAKEIGAGRTWRATRSEWSRLSRSVEGQRIAALHLLVRNQKVKKVKKTAKTEHSANAKNEARPVRVRQPSTIGAFEAAARAPALAFADWGHRDSCGDQEAEDAELLHGAAEAPSWTPAGLCRVSGTRPTAATTANQAGLQQLFARLNAEKWIAD